MRASAPRTCACGAPGDSLPGGALFHRAAFPARWLSLPRRSDRVHARRWMGPSEAAQRIIGLLNELRDLPLDEGYGPCCNADSDGSDDYVEFLAPDALARTVRVSRREEAPPALRSLLERLDAAEAELRNPAGAGRPAACPGPAEMPSPHHVARADALVCGHRGARRPLPGILARWPGRAGDRPTDGASRRRRSRRSFPSTSGSPARSWRCRTEAMDSWWPTRRAPAGGSSGTDRRAAWPCPNPASCWASR